MQTSSTLQFQGSFDGFRSVHQPLALLRDPASFLDWLHSKTNEPDAKNLILSTLVEAAQGEGYASNCALTMLLLTLWPGLDAIRRRSIWRGISTADEVASDVLARTTEAVRRLDLGRVNQIAATVLRNVERDMIRARLRDAARHQASARCPATNRLTRCPVPGSEVAFLIQKPIPADSNRKRQA